MAIPPKPPPRDSELLLRVFAGVFGAFLGLVLLKFGNPPIMEKYVTQPENVWEFLLNFPWPISWAYMLLVLVVLAGFFCVRWRSVSHAWFLALPLVWLLWQCLAATQTLDARLSVPTVKHFAACVACFYLGFFCLGRAPSLNLFWGALLAAFVIMTAWGWDQHFGGLKASRDFFWKEIYPTLKEVPPEYLKKISSDRIFATLFYPNALAGAVLLFLPPLLCIVSEARQYLTLPARSFLMACIAAAALGCLYWSGSKGGWLLMLLLGLLVLMRLSLGKTFKWTLLILVLVAGTTGFIWKYSAFFKRGATSVSARFDYWRAASQTAVSHPVFGTGPGTFSIPYEQLKAPESEMSRLVHNDYLEQASDSGFPGFIFYAFFIAVGLWWSSRTWSGQPPNLRFYVWLGLLGWALQGFFEFGLFIPALSWPAFALLGLLLAKVTPAIKHMKSV